MRLLRMPYDHHHLLPSHERLEPSIEGLVALLDDGHSARPHHVLRSREELLEQLVLRAQLNIDGPITQSKLVAPHVTFVNGR